MATAFLYVHVLVIVQLIHRQYKMYNNGSLVLFSTALPYFAYVSDLKRQTQRVTLTLLKRISNTFAGELAVVLPAGLVAADDAADLLTVLVLDDRVAAARVAPDAAALPEAGRVRQARGDIGRAAKSADVTKVMSNLQGSASYFRLPYFAFLIFVRWPKHVLGTTFENRATYITKIQTFGNL